MIVFYYLIAAIVLLCLFGLAVPSSGFWCLVLAVTTGAITLAIYIRACKDADTRRQAIL